MFPIGQYHYKVPLRLHNFQNKNIDIFYYFIFVVLGDRRLLEMHIGQAPAFL